MNSDPAAAGNPDRNPRRDATFRTKLALDDVRLVGAARRASSGSSEPNGSGKTTLIKHVLGLFRAEQVGTVRGLRRVYPVADPVGVLVAGRLLADA